MSATNKICYISILTALYVVLGAFLKFNLIGNIMIDLGYLQWVGKKYGDVSNVIR